MSSRRHGRALALQTLFELDSRGAFDELDSAIASQAAQAEPVLDDPTVDFARTLCAGVIADLEEIDELLTRTSQRWRVERMAIVDRNALRLGAYEILHCPDVPREVAINEAVELAKTYGDVGSAAFVNGLLNSIQRPS